MPHTTPSDATPRPHARPRPLISALAACALLSTALPGCETIDTVSSSGAGDSYSYVMGDMSATEVGQLTTAMEAARTVLESSNYRVTSFVRDEIRGTIVAETSQGRSAQMEFEQMGLDRVRMKVRIGVIGDRDESRRILDAIRLRL